SACGPIGFAAPAFERSGHCGSVPGRAHGRDRWPLSLLRQPGAKKPGRFLRRQRNGGSVNLTPQLGLDILAEKYAYASDPQHGHTSAQKIPDRWVSTTCGYCSVGCVMFIGVQVGAT